MNGHTGIGIGHMINGEGLFGVMNVLWNLAKGRGINGCGGSTISLKNGRKKTLFLTLKAKECLL